MLCLVLYRKMEGKTTLGQRGRMLVVRDKAGTMNVK